MIVTIMMYKLFSDGKIVSSHIKSYLHVQAKDKTLK